ncbi:hypothetical protein ACW5W8_05350 [Aeromonas aquatilis]
MTTTQNKRNILKQLEYCRLDRAAELLGCDVSDLIHFGATERVAIYLYLKDNPTALVYFPKITDSFPQHQDLCEKGIFTFDLNTSMRPFGFGIIESDDDGNIIGFESESEFKAELYGLWQLPPYIVTDIENDMLPDMENLLIRVSAVTSDGDFAYADLKEWGFRPTVHDCYLKNVDLIRIDECFTNNGNTKPLLRISKSANEQEAQSRPPKEIKPNGVAERHAVNREIILAAAIYAKRTWPDECGTTAKEWAATILNHEHVLFSETNSGKAILADQQIERILGAAMNSGRPHKSK